ncbi:MAG: hypothetical protein ISS48_02430 [Candidatus Aenigmarchaeota archaeon]|nr:hypothetical protein [Candidatus Aenigmarchaeota archaeon]
MDGNMNGTSIYYNTVCNLEQAISSVRIIRKLAKKKKIETLTYNDSPNTRDLVLDHTSDREGVFELLKKFNQKSSYKNNVLRCSPITDDTGPMNFVFIKMPDGKYYMSERCKTWGVDYVHLFFYDAFQKITEKNEMEIEFYDDEFGDRIFKDGKIFDENRRIVEKPTQEQLNEMEKKNLKMHENLHSSIDKMVPIFLTGREEAMLTRTRMYIHNKKYKKAEEVLKKFSSLYPNNIDYYLLKALIRSYQNREKEMAGLWLKAIELNEKWVEIRAKEGYEMFPEDAIDHLLLLKKYEPNNKVINRLLKRWKK